jgi:mercuric ion transport protein
MSKNLLNLWTLQVLAWDHERVTRMSDKALLRVGIIGAVVAAVCCFTPVLVLLLGAVGLSAAIGWLDYVLWPALVLFLGLTAFALWKRRSA